MIEYKVSGKFDNAERFSVVVEASNTWHAQAIAKKMFANKVVAMSAFKVGA
jgi:hypothetical protein